MISMFGDLLLNRGPEMPEFLRRTESLYLREFAFEQQPEIYEHNRRLTP